MFNLSHLSLFCVLVALIVAYDLFGTLNVAGLELAMLIYLNAAGSFKATLQLRLAKNKRDCSDDIDYWAWVSLFTLPCSKLKLGYAFRIIVLQIRKGKALLMSKAHIYRPLSIHSHTAETHLPVNKTTE